MDLNDGNPIFQRLASYTAQARLILFLGAGFSLDAQNRAGALIPSVSDITQQLWAAAFPGEDYDGSGLQDVYDAALQQARRATLELMRDSFTTDSRTLPEHYNLWFSLPWHRVYTLNIDDLASAAAHAFDLERPIVEISALSSPILPQADALQVIHLNGTLDDLPNVTFGGRQYAERLAHVDVWYANLARELVSHPVVYVGTTLDEPPLWQYVEARGSKLQGTGLRPGSFLITPELTRAREVALKRYQVEWMPGTTASFANQVLRRLSDDAKRGHSILRRVRSKDLAPLLDLSAVVDDSMDDEREFLMGREPRWSDFGPRGFAAIRRVDEDLATRCTSEGLRLIVLTGTAGTGKTACAMRLILHLRDAGQLIVTLNEDADLRPHSIRRAVEATDADVLLIEDLERLGKNADRILDDIAEAKPDLVVVTTIRSTRFDKLGLASYLETRGEAESIVIPPLADEDIDALLDVLDQGNRLGAMKGKPRGHQRGVLTGKCGRQLLVAMMEATSGRRFDARVESECSEMSPDGALVYAVVGLATAFRIRISRQLLLMAVGGDPADRISTLDELERTHLVVRDKRGNVGLRHRMIAERAVEFFRHERMISTPLRGLAFGLAASVTPGELRSSQEGQSLIRVMNHERLMEFLRSLDGETPDVVEIRQVYEVLEPLLSQDHHYWLQRGSFETEVGELDLAKNFIEQARGLAPDDPYVRTQWAYMTLKRASRNSEDPGSVEQVEVAFQELADVIEQRGRKDAYPYHVYGSQGWAWVKHGRLAPDDKVRTLLDLRHVVDEGANLHREDRELKQLAKDLEQRYLLLATQ